MKDKRGLYYYPFPQNKRVKMYVRRFGGDVEFRMWHQDDPEMWDAHGWLSHDAIVQAAKKFDKKSFNPDQAYDIHVATELLREDRRVPFSR